MTDPEAPPLGALLPMPRLAQLTTWAAAAIGRSVSRAQIGDDPPPAPFNPTALSEAQLFAMLVERADCRGATLLVEQHPQTTEWTAAFMVDGAALFRTDPDADPRTVLERLLWTDTHAVT